MNLLRLLFRRIFHQKYFTIINLVSLSIGLVFTILAFLYVQDELKVDKHFSNTKDTYRLAMNNGRKHQMHVGQPAIFTDEIVKAIPEIDQGMRLSYWNINMKAGDKRLVVDRFLWADTNFFSFFGWNLIEGDIKTAIKAPYTAVISEKHAKLLFGNESPIGKVVNMDNNYNMTITGVFEDMPEHSHIRMDFVGAIATLNKQEDWFMTQWGPHSFASYFKIASGINIPMVEQKIVDVWNTKSEDYDCTGPHVKAQLQPFSDIYLRSGHLGQGMSNIHLLWGVAVISIFILIISCFNFINLTVALQGKQTVENGIKKVLGAGMRTFMKQVFAEVTFYLLAAILLAMLIVKLILPGINSFIDMELSFSLVNNIPLIIFIIAVCLILLFVTGSFPLLRIFRAETANILKGNVSFVMRKNGKNQFSIRNSLVIAQFTIGIILIVSSLIVNKQLHLIRQHEIGFDKNQVLAIRNGEGDSERRFKLLSDIISTYPEVKKVGYGRNVPTRGISNWGSAGVLGDKLNEMSGCGIIAIGPGYFDVIGAEFLEGRDFDKTKKQEPDKIIINEALARVLSLDEPVGAVLDRVWGLTAEIIGVVKNIEYNTIHYKTHPAVYFYRENFSRPFQYIIVKMETAEMDKTLATIKKEWSSISPEFPIQYFFLDEQFASNYRMEARIATILNVLTIVAIVLSCLGLFGLALFTINGRIKEIGIRKVNGARTIEVLALINKDFLTWIIIAFVIAIPIASFFIYRWLEGFAYRTSYPWWTVVLTGIIASGVALLTVSWQSWRAARRNPVESLRYE
ncbi:MAG: ABC transporter permease [Bacteroidales bacterium]|nr:ABC transporter permease [Bacteroidales bacterium]